jgi:hypothetical protein
VRLVGIDRCGWIDTEFDAEFFTTFEAFREIFFIDNPRNSLLEEVVKLFCHTSIMRNIATNQVTFLDCFEVFFAFFALQDWI